MFSSVTAVECFISKFPLFFDLVEMERDELCGPIGEGGSISVAVVTAPGAVYIVHCLEVLGDLDGVHAAQVDCVLVGECL